MVDWILVQTRVGREDWARKNVEAQGLRTLMPMYQRPFLVRHQVEFKPKPLYPGYLFVEIVDRWMVLRSTYGILRIVMTGDNPASVPEKVVSYLTEIMDESGFVTLDEELPERFKKGQRVRITSDGPLKDQIGLYQGITPGGRIRLLLSIMGRDVPKDLGNDEVEDAEEEEEETEA